MTKAQPLNHRLRPVVAALTTPAKYRSACAWAERIAFTAVTSYVAADTAARRVGKIKGHAEITKVALAAGRLIAALNGMHGEARIALRDQLGGPFAYRAMAKSLSEYAESFDRAEASVASSSSNSENFSPKRGRPPDIFVGAVTDAASQAFEDLTGTDALVATDFDSGRAYGPWMDFLGAVFAEAGILANVEHYAKRPRR